MTDEHDDTMGPDDLEPELRDALRNYGRTLDEAADARAGGATVVSITEAPGRRSSRMAPLLAAAASIALVLAAAGGYAFLRDRGGTTGFSTEIDPADCIEVDLPADLPISIEDLAKLTEFMNLQILVGREAYARTIEEVDPTDEDFNEIQLRHAQALAEEAGLMELDEDRERIEEAMIGVDYLDFDSLPPELRSTLPDLPSEPVATDRESVEGVLADHGDELAAEFPTANPQGLTVAPASVADAVGLGYDQVIRFDVGVDRSGYEDFEQAHVILAVAIEETAPSCLRFRDTDIVALFLGPVASRVDWEVRHGVIVETMTWIVHPDAQSMADLLVFPYENIEDSVTSTIVDEGELLSTPVEQDLELDGMPVTTTTQP